jgi:hypothetical protein
VKEFAYWVGVSLTTTILAIAIVMVGLSVLDVIFMRMFR